MEGIAKALDHLGEQVLVLSTVAISEQDLDRCLLEVVGGPYD